ncbi:MAG: hypothetical protein V1913_10770 [Fibrobacterota bacterium]
MKRRKMPFCALKKIFPVLSVCLLWAACAHRAACPPLPVAPAEAVERGFVPARPLHARLSALLQKGPLGFAAEGDLFFVPPDTLRLEVRAEWGEVLLDLVAAGRTLRVRTPEGELPLAQDPVTEALMARGALYALLAGRPGLLHCLDTAGRQAFCEGGAAAYRDNVSRVTLEPSGVRVATLVSLDGRFAYEVLQEERVENESLPKKYRLRLAGGPSVVLTVSERQNGKPLSGAAILK